MSDEAIDSAASLGPHELGVCNGAFTRNVPHNAALGLELVSAGSGHASIRMPWAQDDPAKPIAAATAHFLIVE